MRVLIAGNSQGGALMRAVQGGLTPHSAGLDLYFYVVPGGTGPYFKIEDDHLVTTSFNKDFPPYKHPEDTDTHPLCFFDAILVSALGYVDGGFAYNNPIVNQGVIPEFGPREGISEKPLISRATLAAIIRAGLLKQQGYIFLNELVKVFHKRVLVQPFPCPSEYLLERDDWILKQLYYDERAANRFFLEQRDIVNADVCNKLGAELFEYPDPAFRAANFTPRRLMRDNDGLHPKAEYGAMVLSQLTEALRRSTTP